MWPKVEYEEIPWERSDDALLMIPRSKRRKITSTYQAAVPATIASASWRAPSDLLTRSSDLRALIARFDQNQAARGYNLPALMLRSESSSSSQIERLTSSVRNVALAELSDKTPENAQVIAGNVSAMRKAIADPGTLDLATVESIHDTLMRGTDERSGLRDEQVWIGGTPYSPHGAIFVPPHASRVAPALDDLFAFARRGDIDLIAKSAIFHAQFETIHPFTDGNGRTGRALLHRQLAEEEVLIHATLPISAGLLNNVNSYMGALGAYHDGQLEPIIECLLDALELAVVIGSHMASEVDAVLDRWNDATNNRAGSAALRLPALLVEQPVVNITYVSDHLGITDRAARNLVSMACERGILQKIGNAKRGAFYQASELIDIMEEASGKEGIRRMAAR